MPKPNGFIAFVRQRLHEYTQKGHVSGLKEAVRLFGHEWGDMSPDERKPYVDKAKRWKHRQETISNGGHPHSISEIKPSEDAENKQFSFVNSLLEERNPTNIIFVFMSCNYFCQTTSPPEAFLPAEIGMCAFSVKLGIIDNYWTLVDPQCLPKGKLLDGKERKNLHEVPLPPFEQRFQDLERILLNISQFLKRYRSLSGELTNIFCLPSQTHIIDGCLQWLKQTVDSPDAEIRYELQQLPYLLYRLNQIALENPAEQVRRSWVCRLVKPTGVDDLKQLKFSSISECSELFASTKRNFEPGLACPYHEKAVPHAMQYCCLGTVNRFAMNMLEVLAPRFRIPIKPGYHVPLDNSEDQRERRNELLIKWGFLPEYLVYTEIDSRDESGPVSDNPRCGEDRWVWKNETVASNSFAIIFPKNDEDHLPDYSLEDVGDLPMIAEVKPVKKIFEGLERKDVYPVTIQEDYLAINFGDNFSSCDNVYILGGDLYKHRIEMEGFNSSDFFW